MGKKMRDQQVRRTIRSRSRTAIAVAATAMLALGLGVSPAVSAEKDGDGSSVSTQETPSNRPRTAEGRAIEAASSYLAAHAREVHRAKGDTFRRTTATRGTQGLWYVAFERTHRGLPVVGGDLVVLVDRHGNALRANVQQTRAIQLDSTEATRSRAQARTAARQNLDNVQSVTRPRLVVLARGPARLAWDTTAAGRSDGDRARVRVLSDATTGAVLETMDEVVAGQGSGHYYPNVSFPTTDDGGGAFSMRDPSRFGVECADQSGSVLTGNDDQWGGPGGSAALALERACVDVLYGLDREIAMLDDWFGRDGIDGFGGSVPAWVGLNDVNAYYDGSITSYGHTADGLRPLTSIDIVAHEYGHQIFDYTPGSSTGDNETGGLNEATGDIFGALTEAYAANPSDPADYLVGEEVDLDGSGPIRNMAHPSSIGTAVDCYSAAVADPNQVEVHDAAGPLNHWFYLLAEGSGPASPTCDGSTVTGIGMQRAAEIFYNALLMKTSFWTHADARNATLFAARALYGNTDCTNFGATAAAWGGVDVAATPSEPTCAVPSGPAEVSTTLIIDSSGSMSSEDPNDQRKDAGVAYLTASQETDEVGVVDFDDSVRLLSDPVDVGTNRAFLTNAISTIDSSGGTDLGLGLGTGCDSLDRATAPVRAAIFLTDGVGSYNGEADCYVQKGWPVYSIGLGSGVDAALLQDIATSTGGRYLAIDDATNLICEFQQIRAEIGGQVPGSCAPTGSVGQGGAFTQDVDVPAGTGQTTFTLSYGGSTPLAPGGASANAAPDGTALSLSLLSPTNVSYDRNTVSPDFFASVGQTYESFTVTGPAPGLWKATVTGDSVPGGTATFNLSTVVLGGGGPPPAPGTIGVLTPPSIIGAARVGSPISVSPGAYDVPSPTFAYLWLLDGVPVPGATGATFTPAPADVGKAVQARVTVTKDGFDPKVLFTDDQTVAPGAAPTATTPPSITGDGAVGETLTAVDGTWSRAGATLSRQWLRDGVALPGETGATYDVVLADLGKEISVEVTATQLGYDDGVARSGAVTIVRNGDLTNTVLPSISGTPGLGRTLTASPGGWSQPGATFGYQWRRNGAAIPGATSATYGVGASDLGRSLDVLVTAALDGYESSSASAAPVSVPRLASVTSASLARKMVREGQRGRVKALVQVSGVRPSGLVQVMKGDRVLVEKSLRRRGATHRWLRLPELGRGRHVLDVVYVGDSRVAPSTDRVRLRVKRARR